jgi:hypothetical protein
MGGYVLPDGLVDQLSPGHFGLGQVGPFLVEHLQLEMSRGFVRPQPVRAQLRLDVSQQRGQLALLRYPLPLEPALVFGKLGGLGFGISIGALERRLAPALHLLANRLQQRRHPALIGALHIPRPAHVVDELFDAATRVLDLLHLREGVEPVGNVRHQTALVGLGHVAHVLDVEELGDANLAVGNVEGELHVAAVVRLVELVVVDEIGPVDVEERTERQAVVPAGAEVAHVNLVVAGGFALAPQQQALLGRHALFVDVVDCEAQNQRPYQAEYDFSIPVHDIFGAYVCHLDAARLDEVEGDVCVFEALDAQLGFGGIAA